ncbi:CehA/McbA family metallohydrolase [uncultured Oscillibacter sp.]|uniref:CehA/McbA family metallohydrolase n=1 Tax=uncultured Oscillibacter sp. TaxID=876091 RepID=UPI00262CC0D5|nr:CehA/McbA family metallohydrolase [uncultured Oscillibacter sp.]
MKTSQISFREDISKEKEGSYYERVFSVPENVCRLDIHYEYRRYREAEAPPGVCLRTEESVVDLALRDGRGNYLGASGAGRGNIHLSPWDSSPGYARTEIGAGDWAVIVGAYKVPDQGVSVLYTVTFTYRERTLLIGDIHVHTTASDGAFPSRAAALMAKDAGLDFLFLTDHNGYAHNRMLPEVEGLTVLPGSEWTHYQGHAGMLGVSRPLSSAFCVNSRKEAWEKLAEARRNGALLVLNHPFCPSCGWHFGFKDKGFDLIEAVNGGTVPQANRKCLRWWHEQLCRGKRYPIAGGSDYHRPEPGRHMGQPSTAVYAMSRSPADILEALRQGESYIIAWPGAPVLWAEAEGAVLGGTARRGAETRIRLEGLRGGDRIRLITDLQREDILCGPDTFRLELERRFPGARFVRFEVLRRSSLILLSNPIYFA